MSSNAKNDFSQGKVWACILSQAIPLTVAQMVHVLYNLVDRIYLGTCPELPALPSPAWVSFFPLSALFQPSAVCLAPAVHRCAPLPGAPATMSVPSVLWAPPLRCW